MSSLKDWRARIQSALGDLPPNVVESVRDHLETLTKVDGYGTSKLLEDLSATGSCEELGRMLLVDLLLAVVQSSWELSRIMKEHARDVDAFNPLPGDNELRSITTSTIEQVLHLYSSGPSVRQAMESLHEAECPITAFILEASRRAGPMPDHVDRAFQSEFVGGVVNDLDEYPREQRPKIYVPVFAILQSSGTGKTRAAMQLCHKRLGLYTCIRHSPITASKNSKSHAALRTSAPSQDREVYNHLVPRGVTSRHRRRHNVPTESNSQNRSFPSNRDSNHTGDDDDDDDDKSFEDAGKAQIAVASWLWAFATEFTGFIKEQKPELDDCWASFVQRTSAMLMDDITPGFRLTPASAGMKPSTNGSSSMSRNTTSSGRPSARDSLLRRIGESAKKQAIVLEDLGRSTGDELVFALSESLIEPFEALQNLIQDEYCFLAIDEAISMTKRRLTELRRLLSYWKFPKFRVLLLDTDNKVVELTGIEHPNTEPSLRTKTPELFLPPPFTAMPHDVFLLQVSKVTLESARSPAIRILTTRSP